MMGKSHKYMLDIPSLSDPYPEQRDGVFVEDDLALRALKPEFRPKRGRKRAESDDIEPMSAIEPKRPHLDTALALSGPGYPHSAYPGSMSAHPDDLDRFPGDHWVTPANLAPGSATGKPGPTTMRWRLNETPTTPHPMSAITPISAQPTDSAFDDVATQSQKMRMRRRHGTAVSSAWPSNSTTPNGKLRGRPPTNRSVKDGPFISFPANPKAREGPAIDLSRSQLHTPSDDGRTPSVAPSPASPFRVPAYPTPISATVKPPGRGERLSLQVPQHVGNPVRLVTPTVVVNGQDDPSTYATSSTHTFRRPDSAQSNRGHEASAATPSHSHFHSHSLSQSGTVLPSTQPWIPTISPEALKRALAADLLKADLTGRSKSLRGTEAKELAESLLAHLRTHRISSPGSSADDPDARAADDVFRATAASWLGLNALAAPAAAAWNPVGSSGVKKIHVRRFRVGGDGYDSPIDDEDDDEGETKMTFDIEWELSLGGLGGKFQIKGLSIGDGGEAETPEEGESGGVLGLTEAWRRKYLELKDKVLEAALMS
jgi:hypothetical protein